MIKVKDCRHGPMMYLDNDTYIGKGLEKYGESLFHESQFMKQIVSKGDVVIDVGANFGAITIPLAKAVGPTGYVVAIEAQPYIFNILCGNLALNELTNTQAVNRAAAHVDGVMAFLPDIDYKQPNSFGSIYLRQEPVSKTRPISTMTIDSMHLSPRLIKVDVEGMEPQVLEGAVDTIQRSKPIIYVEFLSDEERILQFMKEMNYEVMLHEPPLFNFNNFAKDDEDIFVNDLGESIVSMDLVCWHKDTQLGASSQFLYDISNSPYSRHDVYKEIKGKIYGR